MENKTCFNVNEAITQWRGELTAQPGVSAEQVRELESHLRDSLADLQRRGVTEEEAFWLARRRLGPAKDIAEEIAKADPSTVWKERVFWIVAGLILVQFWFRIAFIPLAALSGVLVRNGGSNAFLSLSTLPMYGVAGWAALAAARGRFPKFLCELGRFLCSPRRVALALGLFLVLSTASVWMNFWIQAKSYALGVNPNPQPHLSLLWNTLANTTWPTVLGFVLFRLTKDLSGRETERSRMTAK